MTTIATDGKSMAGDGYCTGNGIVHGTSMRKVHRLNDGRIIGVTGSAYDIDGFVSWCNNGEKRDQLPKLTEHFEAIVLAPDGRCVTYDNECRTAEQEVPAIAGSGGAIALGAMLAGRTPAEAVAIAALRDTCTGGTITIEHIKQGE